MFSSYRDLHVGAVSANLRGADALHEQILQRTKEHCKSRLHMKDYPNRNLENIMAFSALANTLLKREHH